MKNKRIRLGALAMITLSIFAFTACSNSSSNDAAAKTTTTNEDAVYAQVTAVDGSAVAVAMGIMNENSGEQPTGEQQTGEQSTAQNGETPPEKPADGTTAPAGNAGGSPEMLTLTGETRTLTLSDSVVITKQAMQEPGTQSSSSTSDETASAADITVGSILIITYDGDDITSIQIMGGGGQPGAAPTTAETTK